MEKYQFSKHNELPRVKSSKEQIKESELVVQKEKKDQNEEEIEMTEDLE